ncbi:MAG: hypothetical protein CMP67_11100 [Flavobacteriales bacterium]|nr:hypothetical protein [Flavobacteriales bacterium]MBO72112.1 hypothetical protein [Flavobacteriales bacterium]
MKKNKNIDFSETKPFKRKAKLKTRVWGPFWLFQTRGLFSGLLLLISGSFYFFWALVKQNLMISAVWIFWAPGIFVTLLALRNKTKNTKSSNETNQE